MRLQSITDLGNNIGNKADDLTEQRGKQQCYEHDEYHTDDSSDNSDYILTKGVIVSDHGSKEDKEARPNESQGNEKVYKALLIGSNHVGENGRGNDKQRNGNERVRNSNKDILEASLALKQSCQTPVCRDKQQKRNDNADKLREDRGE